MERAFPPPPEDVAVTQSCMQESGARLHEAPRASMFGGTRSADYPPASGSLAEMIRRPRPETPLPHEGPSPCPASRDLAPGSPPPCWSPWPRRASPWPSRPRRSPARSTATPTRSTRSPGAPTARRSSPAGSTTRSGSGTPPPARRSRSSRGTRTSSWRSPRRPTASRSSRGASTRRPRSGPCASPGMLKDLAGNPAGVHGLAVQPRRQAGRGRLGQDGQDLGPGRRDPRQGPRRPRGRRRVGRLARRRRPDRLGRQGADHPPLERGRRRPQGVIETPADTVLGLAYLPNNQQLVSAGSDGLARLWQLPVAEPR